MKPEEFLIQNNIEIGNIDIKVNKTKDKIDYLILYLDNNDKLNISIDNYFKYKINTLNGFDIKTYQILKDEEKVFNAYQSCLRKLNIKDYSIKQIKNHLNKYELNDFEINGIIDKLKQYSLLDDDKYCFNRINYLNNNLISFKQIKNKLINEGINNEIIDKYLIYEYSLEQDKANKIALKYSKTIKNKSINAIKQNIISKLVNLGYSYDISKNSITDIIFTDNDKELINSEYNKCINKYIKRYEGYDLKQHVYKYLLSKGFNIDDIKNVMEVSDE